MSWFSGRRYVHHFLFCNVMYLENTNIIVNRSWTVLAAPVFALTRSISKRKARQAKAKSGKNQRTRCHRDVEGARIVDCIPCAHIIYTALFYFCSQILVIAYFWFSPFIVFLPLSQSREENESVQ